MSWIIWVGLLIYFLRKGAVGVRKAMKEFEEQAPKGNNPTGQGEQKPASPLVEWLEDVGRKVEALGNETMAETGRKEPSPHRSAVPSNHVPMMSQSSSLFKPSKRVNLSQGYRGLDTPDNVEGGHLMVEELGETQLSGSDRCHHPAAFLHQLGSDGQRLSRQFRNAIIMKEVLDRKYE